MYESRPLLATRAKYRKLSFMLSDAILSGQGWFMSLSGTMGVTVCHLEKGIFKLRAANVWSEGFGTVLHIACFRKFSKDIEI